MLTPGCVCLVQPLDLSHFPFDSLDLLVLLQFLDTSGEDHPGVTIHASSGGTEVRVSHACARTGRMPLFPTLALKKLRMRVAALPRRLRPTRLPSRAHYCARLPHHRGMPPASQLFTVGRGDAVAEWHIENITLDVPPAQDEGAFFRVCARAASCLRERAAGPAAAATPPHAHTRTCCRPAARPTTLPGALAAALTPLRPTAAGGRIRERPGWPDGPVPAGEDQASGGAVWRGVGEGEVLGAARHVAGLCCTALHCTDCPALHCFLPPLLLLLLLLLLLQGAALLAVSPDEHGDAGGAGARGSDEGVGGGRASELHAARASPARPPTRVPCPWAPLLPSSGCSALW